MTEPAIVVTEPVGLSAIIRIDRTPGAVSAVSGSPTSSRSTGPRSGRNEIRTFLSEPPGALTWPLGGRHSLQCMGMGWRIGLVAVVAAAVLGGLVPHAVASGAESAGATMVQAVESPLASPTSCTDATCGKGSPAPAPPSPAVALVAVLGALAIAAAVAAWVRRRPAEVGALPSGRRDRPFHPPRFS
jgi:hypothetical protein